MGGMHTVALSMLVSVTLLAATASAGPASQPASQPTTHPVQQTDDGIVLLHARDVTIHGRTVRYEPNPHKNTVGFWTHKEDWVSWDFDVTKPGKFEVLPLQGCGKGSGGALVEFSIDGQQTFKMTVQDTGGFQNFLERNIGTAELTPGRHTLTVKPQTKPGAAVMDLRQITLKPVESK
jgi:hypothetical protein